MSNLAKCNNIIGPKNKRCGSVINLNGFHEVTHYKSNFMHKDNQTFWLYPCRNCDGYATFTPAEVHKMKSETSSQE